MVLLNEMIVDIDGGVCIKNNYSYYTYQKEITDCVCNDSTQQVIENLITGEYVRIRINTNPNYYSNPDLELECLNLTGETISTWFESYLNDIATTGYTSILYQEIETRVIYESLTGNYYIVEHTGSTTCTVDTAPRWAIIDTTTNELWYGLGAFDYDELDNCDLPTGTKLVLLRDINKNSQTYLSEDIITRCS